MKMNAVWYPVSDWEAAKRFYGQTLGLRQTHVSDEQGWVAYATGPVPLFLVRKPERAGIAGGAVVTLEVDDLEQVVSRLTAAGCQVEAQGESSRIVTVYDPDGNMLEISLPVG